MWAVKVDHEFTKMRNMKREMDVMGNLCGQFNEVATIENIIIDSKLIGGQPCQWGLLTEFLKKSKN